MEGQLSYLVAGLYTFIEGPGEVNSIKARNRLGGSIGNIAGKHRAVSGFWISTGGATPLLPLPLPAMPALMFGLTPGLDRVGIASNCHDLPCSGPGSNIALNRYITGDRITTGKDTYTGSS